MFAISRASEDVRIYTNDPETLGQRLATDVAKNAAFDFTTKASSSRPRSLPKR